MKTKAKKLQLAKITISKIDKNNLGLIEGGSQFIGCANKTRNPLDPQCNQSNGIC